MRLRESELKHKEEWLEKGYRLPSFDREKARLAARTAPVWVHFGCGNIFRAFPAMILQRLLDAGLAEAGMIVAGGRDSEILDKIYRPMDNLSLLVTLKSDGTVEKTVTASITDSFAMEPGSEDFEQLKKVFAAPSLQIASFTITEKGYNLKTPDGTYLPEVLADFQSGPASPESYMGKVASLLLHRYENGAYPLCMASMDNCSQNGDRLREAMTDFARQWADAGFADSGFEHYLNDPGQVGFPWSMIDKITPRPDEKVREMLTADGFEDVDNIITSKKTFAAPFVNAEETEYLVIEDLFPNGRPPLERAGVILTDRETVEKTERMKVCTCLNPLHTAMALYGCLLGYHKISEEMNDADIVNLIKKVGYTEGLPVVTNPGILDPKEFMDTVVNIRLRNPYMPDTPQRIATDTSQKLAIRFGVTVSEYRKRFPERIPELIAIPLVFAGFCRYHIGLDDQGNPLEVSPDPMREYLVQALEGITLGSQPTHAQLEPLLSNAHIFGCNLYEAGLGEKVEELFTELLVGPGAVRGVLRKYL